MVLLPVTCVHIFLCRLFAGAAACPLWVTHLTCETWFNWMFERSTQNSLDGSGFEFWSVEFYNFNLPVGSSHNNSRRMCTQGLLWIQLIADAKNPIHTFITNSWRLRMAFEMCLFIAHGFRLNRFTNSYLCILPSMLSEIDVRKVELWHFEYGMNTGKIQLMSPTFPDNFANFKLLARICKQNNQHHKAFHNNVLVLGTPMLIEDSYTNWAVCSVHCKQRIEELLETLKCSLLFQDWNNLISLKTNEK